MELAKGLLAEYAGISFSEALELLRRHAEQQGRSLTAVARALAERSLAPEDVVTRQPRLS